MSSRAEPVVPTRSTQPRPIWPASDRRRSRTAATGSPLVRVGILGAVEAVHAGPPRVGLEGVGAGQGIFEEGGHAIEIGLGGPSCALGRHGAHPDLADYLFPGFGAARDIRQIGRLERQTAGARAVVVAPDTVLVEEGGFGSRGRFRRIWSGPGRVCMQGQEGDGEGYGRDSRRRFRQRPTQARSRHQTFLSRNQQAPDGTQARGFTLSFSMPDSR